ncbi:unnamed protein product [Bursaphelenchus okinawaensis]|uniref:Dolichyl-diphosphooligosaccharide--protein glycosyltransferase subunit 2 n=1 Tax=Bursaphelenchus okinawaensis TaxID=465554 RepID=A0A811LQS8_9BILA|nr:unnamed protein product [Bursaphelenchus okinawaensis]CAG9126025.1 unnamed protein product [Bursaphelenchus okinawaensis]
MSRLLLLLGVFLTIVSAQLPKLTVQDATLVDGLGASQNLVSGQKLGKVVDLDSSHDLKLTFKVLASNKPVSVHQSFVIFVNDKTGKQVAYVLEQDAKTETYTFDLQMKTHGKEFGGEAGTYSAHLLLGDVKYEGFDWVFAQFNVKVEAVSVEVIPPSQQVHYQPKKEIKHLFREPEARPPAFFAHIFALVCAAPLLILLVSWLAIGINFGRLPFSIWVLGFHGGVISIFTLYLYFWIQLNMFDTLYYLAPISVVTFISGHRLFRSLASQK